MNPTRQLTCGEKAALDRLRTAIRATKAEAGPDDVVCATCGDDVMPTRLRALGFPMFDCATCGYRDVDDVELR